jgi:peptidoglycan hydrolase-like protein with peptidoglycan-binding domain
MKAFEIIAWKLKMNNFSTLFIIFSFLCFSSASFAVTLTCERTSSDASGFANYRSFESWWPKNISLDGNKFGKSLPSSTSTIYTEKRMSTSSQRVNKKYILLKSGMLVGTLTGGGPDVVTRYKCNLTSTELLAQSSTPQPSYKTSKFPSETICNSSNLNGCNTEEVCSRATNKVSNQRFWETRSQWEDYVYEAKSRGLSCNVSFTPTVTAAKPSVTPAPAPAPKLVSSKQVFRSQEALQVLGLYSGKLDGLAGSGTANAIKEWQQRNGLPKTGEVTDLQLAKLELEAIQHLRKTKSKPVAVASVKDIKSDKYAGIEFGNYHALVIGIDEYKHLPKLKTAVNDAEAVAAVLKSDYGFDVNLLRNAKRSDVMDALDDYEKRLGINDNLLIYYAGHGDLDKKSEQGYWWPADAKKGKRSNWISNSHISASLKALEARHVIVVADSCYSGTLVRSVTTSVDSRAKDVRSLNSKRSRGALTSGGLEQVVDSVGGNHSPFAKAFINALNDNKDVVDMSSMYPQIRRSVLMSTDQSPVYSDIRKTGDEGGDFFFVRRR